MKLKLIATLSLACLCSPTWAADKTSTTATTTNQFAIAGMHCNGCAGGLTAELKATRGVGTANVTFSNKLAVVSYDTNQVSAEKLIKVIKEAGFTAKPVTP